MELQLLVLILFIGLGAFLVVKVWEMKGILNNMTKICDRMINRCNKIIKDLGTVEDGLQETNVQQKAKKNPSKLRWTKKRFYL